MFLAKLANEEKLAFLNLAQTLIGADGVLNKDEVAMMEEYKVEMGLDISTEGSQEEIEQSINVFKNTTTAMKKQIAFELMALACADKEFAPVEHDLLEKLGASWELESSFLVACNKCVEELLNLYEKIGVLVGE